MTSQLQKHIRLFQYLVCRRSSIRSSSQLSSFTNLTNSHSVVIRTAPFQNFSFSDFVGKDTLTNSNNTFRGIKAHHEKENDHDDDENYDDIGVKDKNEANFRARKKLDVLVKALDVANGLKAMAVSCMAKDDPKQYERFEFQSWIQKEGELADAFSKAIKYVARMRSDDPAKKSEMLLRDMIARHETIQKESRFQIGTFDCQFSSENVDALLNSIEKDFEQSAQPQVTEISKIRFGIPVPDTKDFTNVLHSWASSKVRKKGIYAEGILYRMIELAYMYPENFSMPDSNTFGLVVKCHAGSTLKDALNRIENLHETHNRLAEMDYPGIVKNDPFLLMHSIKSVDNINTEKEYMLVQGWFDRLHSFVMQPSVESNVAPQSTKEKLDLTGTYSSIIRCYSKMRWVRDAPEKTFDALERMIGLAKRCKERDSYATLDLKVNSFNLFLGMSTPINDTATIEKKLSVMNSMIQAAELSLDSPATTDRLLPIPNDQSFASCIKALSTLKDSHRAIKEAQRLLDTFESLQKINSAIEPSSKVYNALIELYTDISVRDKQLAQELPSICDEICNRMKSQSPSVEPDSMTYTLLLKSCTINHVNVENKEQKLQRARDIFDKISKCNEKEGPRLNDKCYFYMMKCVAQNVNDPEDKKTQIIQLFSQACRGGFVSSDVLRALRINTNDEEYKKIVGDGRLADKWVANVTSGLALYTDGTTGGAGKNARRKGKSTSDWAKKQRQKDEEIRNRKKAKAEKKRNRKIRMVGDN